MGGFFKRLRIISSKTIKIKNSPTLCIKFLKEISMLKKTFMKIAIVIANNVLIKLFINIFFIIFEGVQNSVSRLI